MLKSFRISSGVLPLIMLALPDESEGEAKGFMRWSEYETELPKRRAEPLVCSESGQNLHSLATDIKKGLDVEVVGCEDDLKEHLLIDLDELGVPVRDVGSASARLLCVIGGCGRVAAVV